MNDTFLLGCNYWASSAGTDMWRRWDADCIDTDIEALSRCGVEVLRVFWYCQALDLLTKLQKASPL